MVKLTFAFKNGQSTELTLPVVAQTGDYADVTPAPAPRPTQDTPTAPATPAS